MKVIFIVILAVILAIALFTSASVSVIKLFAQTQTLPKCIDPTGNNRPCMMVISTLPAPTNSIQCQETTGQILPCLYATQTLSNGQQVVVITVYVPPTFLFSPAGVVKVVISENKITEIIRKEPRSIGMDVPSSLCRGIQGVHGCIVFLPGGPGQPPFPIYLTPLPPGPHTAAFRLGWFYGNTGSDYYNPYPLGSNYWLAFNLGLNQGFKASTPYTNCEHFDTCPYPKYDPTKDPKYKPQLLPTPCVSPQGIDICSKTTTSPLGLLVPSHGNISQADNFSSATLLPPTSTNINTTDNLGKGGHATSCINNCTTSTSPTSSCSTKTGSCSQLQQQQHTAAYLQALNSGLPNPYKLGTKDYEHYQAGLDARRLNTGAVAGIATLSGTNGNSNNPQLTSKKCPDGSIIPTKDKCTTTSKQTNPSSSSTGPSSSSSPGGNLPTQSGGSSIGGSGGGSPGSNGDSSSSVGSSSSGSGSGGSGSGSSSSGSGESGNSGPKA